MDPLSGFLTDKEVISLVGYQGSGKSTLSKKLARAIHTDMLEVSDRVKSMYEDYAREKLPSTSERTKQDPNWLGKDVAEGLAEIYKGQQRQVAILSGAREEQLHKYLLKRGIKLWVFEIVAPPALRFQRVYDLHKVQSASQFIEHELSEREMGLDRVCEKAPFRVITGEDTKPYLLVEAIIKRLKEKGARLL